MYTLVEVKFKPNYPVCAGVLLVAVPDGTDPLTKEQMESGIAELGSSKEDREVRISRVLGRLVVAQPTQYAKLPGREDCLVVHFEAGEH